VIAGLRGEDRIAQLCRKKDFSRTFLITANRRISWGRAKAADDDTAYQTACDKGKELCMEM
jgi:hypothetical protein